MINREQLKKRIKTFSSYLKADEFPLFQRKVDWKENLEKGTLPFMSYGESFKVDYKNIDFTGPEINNQEWRAQLNRYQWLGACLDEDVKGGDDYFAMVAADTIKSFYKFREGINIPDKEFLWRCLGDNTLSISVRMGRRFGSGWWGTVPFMRESVIDDIFIENMYKSSVKQVDFMIEYMTTCGNWRISQLSSLLFLGYIFNNDEWTQLAARGLNEAFHSQVDSEGVHEEHTQGYHSWMTKEFSSYYYLSKGLPELNLNIDINKLIKMWEYLIIASAPDGQAVGLNDDTRWGYVNNEIVKENYHKALKTLKNLMELAGNDNIKDITMESRHFKSAGQWFLRNKSSLDTQMLIFDATIYGGGHCHRAVNSVNFFYGNKMLLLDPGTFNYERSDPFCDYGRRTNSHNTLCIDGLSQTKSSVNEDISDISGQCVFVHNSYSGGYSNGKINSTGTHDRLVLWYKNKFCLINDSVVGDGKKFFANFNFLPGEHQFDGESYTTDFGDYDLFVKPVYSNTRLDINEYQGSMEPMAGWISKDGYKLRGAELGSSLLVEGKIKDGGSVTAYVIVPYKDRIKPVAEITNKEELIYEENEDIRNRIFNKPSCYSLLVNGNRFEIVSAYLKYRNSRLHPTIGRTGKFDSDGKLAFVELKDGKVVFAYLYDGTYLNYNDVELIKRTGFGNCEKTF